MKVAVVRGPSLNPWEMQIYEPLALQIELVAVGSSLGHYDVSRIRFPVKRLPCVGEYLAYVPGGTELLYRFLGDPQYLIGFDRLVDWFDIVHTAETGSYYSLQAVRAKERGLVRKVVVSVWETIPFLGEANAIRREHKREVRDKADWFVALTERAKEGLVREGVDPEKVTVIPAGVNTRRFKPGKFEIPRKASQRGRRNSKFEILRGTYGLRKDDFVVLFVGRLVQEKGVYELLAAANLLAKRKETESGKVKFLLVGEGPERKGIQMEVKRLGLEDLVRVHGGVLYERMPELVVSSDVVVLPSLPMEEWEEQFGMILVEAMACGVPVIASRSGAIPEVVGEAGLLVEPGDKGAIAEAILRIRRDRELRQDLIRKGLDLVRRRYDSRKIALLIFKLYKTILELH